MDDLRQQLEELIDYYEHRCGELYEKKWLNAGKPRFLDTTDIYKKALSEAIDQFIKWFQDWLRKEVENMEVIDGKLRQKAVGKFYSGGSSGLYRLAQAQLEYSKKSLRDKIEEMK